MLSNVHSIRIFYVGMLFMHPHMRLHAHVHAQAHACTHACVCAHGHLVIAPVYFFSAGTCCLCSRMCREFGAQVLDLNLAHLT